MQSFGSSKLCEYRGPVAQLVEHQPCKLGVQSSNLCRSTTILSPLIIPELFPVVDLAFVLGVVCCCVDAMLPNISLYRNDVPSLKVYMRKLSGIREGRICAFLSR